MKIIETNLKWNGSLSYNNKPAAIILHNADAITCSIEDIHRWHINNGWSGCGYHYLVRKDGTIHRGRPENAQAAHCTSWNAKSIGICAEGAFMKETMSEVQLNSIQELIADIDKRYGKMSIYGHGEKSSTNCPGVNYPLSKLKNRDYNSQGTGQPSLSHTLEEQCTSVAKKYLGSNTNTVQLILNCFGYNLVVDGECGPATAKAIGEFQRKYGLDVDYKFGPACYEKSYALLKVKVIKKGSTGTEVKLIQAVVGVNVDGDFGSKTEAEVISYQKKYGLSADGIVGQNTWRKILGL